MRRAGILAAGIVGSVTLRNRGEHWAAVYPMTWLAA
jgi:hypothetical protein